MNFAALKTELAARGFEALDDTRRGYYINAGRQQLDNRHLWPYREKGVVGQSPLTVTDLGTIEAVTDETAHVQLRPASFQWLLDTFGDLSLAGSPEFFYVATPSGVPTVATYPSGSIGVQYWRRTPDLVVDADEPESPADYHPIIVDLGVMRAYMDSDNYQAAQAMRSWTEQSISEMANVLLNGQQIAGPQDQQAVTGQSVDG